MSGAEPDWAAVVADGRCDECGLQAGGLPRSGLPSALRAEAEAWAALLNQAGDAALRRRPSPERWSPLESAVHVRDAVAVFTARVELTLTEDEPDVGWWDHEAAVTAERYNEQDPAVVAAGIGDRVDSLVGQLDSLSGQQWTRACVRRGSERFTVDGIARYVLHELRHHRLDAEAGVGLKG